MPESREPSAESEAGEAIAGLAFPQHLALSTWLSAILEPDSINGFVNEPLPRTTPMRVLVIEDEPDLIRALVQSLREEGYAVDQAMDGREGLSKAEVCEYEAVVLDLMLPGMDGLDVLRRLRPIATMCQTVAGITASSLSRRIDLEGVDTELGELGGLLNTMLGRLEASFDQQARFTADASHELRTPLAVVLTQVELALARPRSADEYRDALEACGRAARRMKGLVDDLLTLARADAGKLELRWEPVELGPIVDECAGMLGPLAEGRGVCVVVNAGVAPLEADPERLARVVTNLLSNAILYNRPGGRVTLSVVAEGDAVVLTVADTGVGIPEGDLPRVFDRFFRVDKARSRESGGSGLGLAICKSIVEAHGGTIILASQPGKGTEVIVRLPRAGPPLLPPEL